MGRVLESSAPPAASRSASDHRVFRQCLIVTTGGGEQDDEITTDIRSDHCFRGHELEQLSLPVGRDGRLTAKRLHLSESGQGLSIIIGFELIQRPQAITRPHQLLVVTGGGQQDRHVVGPTIDLDPGELGEHSSCLELRRRIRVGVECPHREALGGDQLSGGKRRFGRPGHGLRKGVGLVLLLCELGDPEVGLLGGGAVAGHQLHLRQ